MFSFFSPKKSTQIGALSFKYYINCYQSIYHADANYYMSLWNNPIRFLSWESKQGMRYFSAYFYIYYIIFMAISWFMGFNRFLHYQKLNQGSCKELAPIFAKLRVKMYKKQSTHSALGPKLYSLRYLSKQIGQARSG